MLKISIPTPCHEDWNKMTPDETGRHCSICAKSVVDFTSMSDEEVKHFFLHKKKEERVCGRFKQTQLSNITIELPQNILSIRMPLWKKFLAACLIAFSATLFSCETKIKDKEGTVEIVGAMKISDTLQTDNTGLVKTNSSQGEPLVKPVQCTITVGITEVLQGDVVIEEAVPVKQPDDSVEVVPVKDTSYENFIGKAFIINDPATPLKTKDPLKADPEKCNDNKNYN